MPNFFENLGKSKIPSLMVLAILFYSGVKLLVSSTEIISITGVAGSVILCIGGIMSVVAFFDYRYKEYTDSAIGQLDKAVTSLGKALKNTQNANNLLERERQGTLRSTPEEKTIGKNGRKEYSIEGEEETLTE